MDYCAYRSRVGELLEQVDPLWLAHLGETIVEAKRIWVIGNGGSMATAMHFAEDLLMAGVKAQALSDVSYLTMASNDFGYENSFLTGLRLLSEKGDIVIGISTSGESRNVLEALRWFKESGYGPTVGLIGRVPSSMVKECTRVLSLDTAGGMIETKIAEDVHLVLCHCISEMVREQKSSPQVQEVQA